ncbi:energy-coupling factor ABC transporter substrate-binding protein [Trichothermofontia sp.]
MKDPEPKLGHAQENWGLLLAVVVLTLFPLIFVRGDYEGADGKAEAAITTLKPDYQPWFNPPLQPVSGEIENLLFVAQAAIGAGLVGYVVGLYKGRHQDTRRHQETPEQDKS